MSRSSTEYVPIGRVGRPHGLDGSFFVEQASDDPERFAVGAVVYVAGERAEVVVSKRGSGGRPVIRLDRGAGARGAVSTRGPGGRRGSRRAGAAPRGADLTVPREALPPTAEGEYYAFQLVGLEVEEEGGRVLGRVAQVAPGVANDVLELESGLAFPLVEACVREVDLERGRIVIAAGFAEPQLP